MENDEIRKEIENIPGGFGAVLVGAVIALLIGIVVQIALSVRLLHAEVQFPASKIGRHDGLQGIYVRFRVRVRAHRHWSSRSVFCLVVLHVGTDMCQHAIQLQ